MSKSTRSVATAARHAPDSCDGTAMASQQHSILEDHRQRAWTLPTRLIRQLMARQAFDENGSTMVMAVFVSVLIAAFSTALLIALTAGPRIDWVQRDAVEARAAGESSLEYLHAHLQDDSDLFKDVRAGTGSVEYCWIAKTLGGQPDIKNNEDWVQFRSGDRTLGEGGAVDDCTSYLDGSIGKCDSLSVPCWTLRFNSSPGGFNANPNKALVESIVRFGCRGSENRCRVRRFQQEFVFRNSSWMPFGVGEASNRHKLRPDPVSLKEVSTTVTTATLTVSEFGKFWYYKNSGDSCSSGISTADVTLTGLSWNTSYNVTAYGDSNCSNAISGTLSFTTLTPGLTLSDFRRGSASPTAELTGWDPVKDGPWSISWYRQGGGAVVSCTDMGNQRTYNFGSLNIFGRYIIKAHEGYSCASNLKLLATVEQILN